MRWPVRGQFVRLDAAWRAILEHHDYPPVLTRCLGEAMAANRRRDVRCALCWSVESARLARLHNDANMIALGQRLLSLELVLEMVDAWLETPFEGGRHVARLAQLDRVE